MSLVKIGCLDAVSTTGTASDSEEVTGATRFSFQATSTGSPTSYRVNLEGSIDGSNWWLLKQGDVGSGLTAGMFGYGNGSADIAPRFIRLKLDALTGGTSPTVTAHLVAI